MKFATVSLLLLLICSHANSQNEPILSIQTNASDTDIRSMVITNSGDHFFIGGKNILDLFDSNTGELLHEFEIPRDDIVYSMTVSDDGKYLVTGQALHVNLWDLNTFELLHNILVRKPSNEWGGVSSVAIIPEWNSFYAGDSLGYIEEFDITTGESKQKELLFGSHIFNLIFSSNNQS